MLDFEYIEPRDFLDKNWQSRMHFFVFSIRRQIAGRLPTTFQTFYSEAQL